MRTAAVFPLFRRSVFAHISSWNLKPAGIALSTREFLYLAVLFSFLSCNDSGKPIAISPLSTRPDGSLAVAARVYSERYDERFFRAAGHHAIVWKEGGAADKALFETEASDRDILDALIEMGAEPGNNLPPETWLEGDNPNSLFPEMRVEGTPVEILVKLSEDIEPVLLREFLSVKGPLQYDPRVGGHADQIERWQSGCVFCLFSCPGGRCSNAGATIRQQVEGVGEWFAREDLLPADGEPVVLIFRLGSENPEQLGRG